MAASDDRNATPGCRQQVANSPGPGAAADVVRAADSPVALAAWMLDHDARSYQDIARAFEGDPVGNLTRDEVLDDITLTWVTNTGVSRVVSTGRISSASSTSRPSRSRLP